MAAAALLLLATAAFSVGSAATAAPIAVWAAACDSSATFERAREALCAVAPCVDVSELGIALAQRELRAGAYGGVLVETTDTARALADFAAASGTPLFRVAAAVADVHPAFERPAAIVVPDGRGLGDSNNNPYLHPLWETRRFAAADWATADLGPALLAAASSGPPPAFTCTVPSDTNMLLNHPLPDDARSAPLGLAMIVKNEAGTIGATLDAARSHVDGWTLLDTGSTDGTARVAKRSALAQTLPGTVQSADFGGFARARNLALQTHGPRTAYTLMPDADFGFVGLWRLRSIAWRLERACARACAPVCAHALKVVRRTPGVDVNMVVMFPSHAQGTPDGWHYRYPVHEVATLGRRGLDGDAIDVPTYARLEPLPGADPSAKSPARWRDFDLPTLREAALVDPNDTRIAFYLARTLQAVELDDEALDAYARRVGMGGWYQEVFFSHYERGQLLATKPDGDPTDAYLAAAAVDPDRAEAYAALAEWHDGKANACPGAGARHQACKLQHRAAGYVYAKEAASRVSPLPTSKLFLLTSVYDWGANLQVSLHGYWLAEGAGDACSTGHAAAKKLAAQFLGKHPYDANIEFYKALSERLDKVVCSL